MFNVIFSRTSRISYSDILNVSIVNLYDSLTLNNVELEDINQESSNIFTVELDANFN